MKTWSARVRGMSLPNFPFEENSFMPVACATVQRVNMERLCEIVKRASIAALENFNAARLLDDRPRPNQTSGFKKKILRREFADHCFLTRRQQLDREQPWNDGNQKLRQHLKSQDQDYLELNFGYEPPERARDYSYRQNGTLNRTQWRKWDQIDVRMYYFDKEMKGTDWLKEAEGMWYIQDYMDFMHMLQTLDIEPAKMVKSPIFLDFCNEDGYQFPNRPSAAYIDHTMPAPLPVNDRACHRFSILSWFFDCRDAGACGYQWEDFVLEYFGAYIEDEERKSDFEEFSFSELPDGAHYQYFNQPWFQICVFLEHNFRNAIAPMHYKLYEMNHAKPIRNLQKAVKALYNQRQSLFNQRSCFDGLGFRAQDGSMIPRGASFLSFQRFNARTNPNMTLRERIFSQLHDELPELDPALLQYIQQFRIPDAELFLRMIRCPNILALRELAVQHRHLLGGQGTASSVQPEYHLQQTLKYFPQAVQSEILYLLKFVERDDSVYVHAPAVHDTKKIMLPQNQMRQWIRETLEVAARVQTLSTPLQLKCYMFTMPEVKGGGVAGFHVLKKLFYTTESMMNAGSKRSIVFVLLQMHLALAILKSSRTEGRDKGLENERDNPLAQLLGLDVVEHGTYKADFLRSEGQDVLWTVGSSLKGWPRRDLNEFVLRKKDSSKTSDKTINVLGMQCTETRGECVISRTPGLGKKEAYCMREKERCLWLLLLYARPGLDQFVAEDNTVVCKEQERMGDGSRERRDIITARLSYEIKDRLHVCVYDDQNAAIFFEKMPGKTDCVCPPFPKYIEEIISDIPDRSLIYVPKKFAQELRKSYSALPVKVFQYDNAKWRMVCVGVRAWAWKRLLVKGIFFDALSRIMTRSSVQLSLYCPVPSTLSRIDLNKYQRELLKLHTDIQEVFGSLEYKKSFMQKNMDLKQTQLIFTIHIKSRRIGQIGDQQADLYTRISRSNRQIYWIRYCQENPAIALVHSCRDMLIDRRLASQLTEKYQDVPMHQDHVILGRSYLFSKTPQSDMLVSFRQNLYIKCPKPYGVLKCGDKFVAGQLKVVPYAKHAFATCLDTRTYDCLLLKRLHKADSDEMQDALKKLRGNNLPYEIIDSQFKWPSTENDKPASFSWVYTENKEVQKELLEKEVEFIINHTFENPRKNLTLTEQKRMYTLPDYFSTEFQTPYKDKSVWQSSDHETWITSIENELQTGAKTNKFSVWNKLRLTTKYLTLIENENGESHNYIINFDTSIQNEFLKSALSDIRRRIDQHTD
jgi:hypothetical protein